jgi:hypothetical protein
MCRCGQDFGDPATFALVAPDPAAVDADGRYCLRQRDPWGALWECRIFGVAGHPIHRPLDDWSGWGDFRPPPDPVAAGPRFQAAQATAEAHRRRFFLKAGWINVFEVMHAVRRFEDVLMDIATDEPEINRLADAIQFADDFGTQTALMLSLPAWRRFFRPRFQRLIEPVLAAGVKAFYHTCGMAWDLLGDLSDLGFHAIWPQMSLYDPAALAGRCRELRLAETFRIAEGGSWFYVEIDNGFPFANVRALIEAIDELRRG